MENINWYPGHMKKTRELIQENLKLVDAVIEVIDARIPDSSRNPIIDQIVGAKPRIIVLSKKDLSDESINREWEEAFRCKGAQAVSVNCMNGAGVKELMKTLERMAVERNSNKAVHKQFRLMIVGVPNVGKSSLINRLTGRKSAQTGDRPGVTRGKQWLKLKNDMQLLDTPGILWPKFEDPREGLNLAFCGSIKDEVLDVATLAMELIGVLMDRYPQLLTERYGLDEPEKTTSDEPDGMAPEESGRAALETMEAIALKRGCILPGKRIDYERTGRMILDEFRSGKIGRISLERPM